MEYYYTIKKNEMLFVATGRLDLDIITLSEVSQTKTHRIMKINMSTSVSGKDSGEILKRRMRQRRVIREGLYEKATCELRCA